MSAEETFFGFGLDSATSTLACNALSAVASVGLDFLPPMPSTPAMKSQVPPSESSVDSLFSTAATSCLTGFESTGLDFALATELAFGLDSVAARGLAVDFTAGACLRGGNSSVVSSNKPAPKPAKEPPSALSVASTVGSVAAEISSCAGIPSVGFKSFVSDLSSTLRLGETSGKSRSSSKGSNFLEPLPK